MLTCSSVTCYKCNKTDRISQLENAESLDLHLMVFDESYGSLNPYGSITNLRAWYLNGEKAKLACFVPGAEELLIIDNTMHARIFSVITQQFRCVNC